jgi:hypothetical protein
MKLRAFVLALAMSGGLTAAVAATHPKPPKIAKRAQAHKVPQHKSSVPKPIARKSQQAAKHTPTAKVAKHKAPKVRKHRA